TCRAPALADRILANSATSSEGFVHRATASKISRTRQLAERQLTMARRFKDLSSQEVLALAISLEEEDGRIYQEYARVLRKDFPAVAAKLDDMRREEDGHRHRLIDLFERKYGKEIPLLGRQDVRGFVRRPSAHSIRPLSPQEIRKRVDLMEAETE